MNGPKNKCNMDVFPSFARWLLPSSGKQALVPPCISQRVVLLVTAKAEASDFLYWMLFSYVRNESAAVLMGTLSLSKTPIKYKAVMPDSL